MRTYFSRRIDAFRINIVEKGRAIQGNPKLLYSNRVCTSLNFEIKNSLIYSICFKVNKQDFFQVFQGSGIGKIEDN